ncbi:hypothetical protein BT96DRAFT_933091 [Gymnopus androsaceus JB14]|uniref:Uncharacterized protein n=1 Tax=Gymnopus androsaceus JB14 TaxID=1447944 RepID=A0A6A4IG85_9AGAR|nr:hypothetical protein BT96DRAFT_933091 [Gymnopus androsaceus JB14]
MSILDIILPMQPTSITGSLVAIHLLIHYSWLSIRRSGQSSGWSLLNIPLIDNVEGVPSCADLKCEYMRLYAVAKGTSIGEVSDGVGNGTMGKRGCWDGVLNGPYSQGQIITEHRGCSTCKQTQINEKYEACSETRFVDYPRVSGSTPRSDSASSKPIPNSNGSIMASPMIKELWRELEVEVKPLHEVIKGLHKLFPAGIVRQCVQAHHAMPSRDADNLSNAMKQELKAEDTEDIQA